SFFFFFSSRRRHTRSKRDWSSDVCSSDLSPLSLTLSPLLRRGERESTSGMVVSRCPINPGGCKSQAQSGRVAVRTLAGPGQSGRSEERRVGKEWRGGRGGE